MQRIEVSQERKLLALFLFLCLLSIGAHGQSHRVASQSPDKKFTLTVTTGGSSEYTEWKYWLNEAGADTVLLTTTLFHDSPPPVAYWNKSSTKLIFEQQDEGLGQSQEIRIYDLMKREVIFQTRGFIWGYNNEHFDPENGIVAFFRKTASVQHNSFDLFALNINNKEIKFICTVETSGDPMTGSPDIQKIDIVKRELTLTFESPQWRTVTSVVRY